jgi:transcriptional regulator with XRE-family HTH domain
MPHDEDLHSLRELLRDAVAASRLSPREVETVLGIGHSTLERLLNGKLDLRVRHILALARMLEVPPGDFLNLGCPDTAEAARHDLNEWLPPTARRKTSARTVAPESPDGLAPLIRILVKQELEALRREEDGSKPGGG